MAQADRPSRPKRKKPKPFKNDRPKSLLSFLFYVTYDETTNAWFHDNADEVLRDFGLTGEVGQVLADMGNHWNDPQEDQRERVVNSLIPHLAKEILTEHYREIW